MKRKLKRKTAKSFEYNGLGFTVLLLNVSLVEIRGVWTPDVDLNDLSNKVLEALAWKPSRLTGHEVRFIRLSFEMTLQEFADRFGVSHPAVLKWEKAHDDPTVMAWSTEKDLRLEIVHSRCGNRTRHFFEAYDQLVKARPATPQEPTAVQLGAMLLSKNSGQSPSQATS